jgi:hypothetical protein
MAGSAPLEDLRAEARYHRERYDLYRAKMYGGRPTTMGRLRELERVKQGAEARVRRAQQSARRTTATDAPSAGRPRERRPTHSDPSSSR